MRRESPRPLRAEALQGNREGCAAKETRNGNDSPVTKIVPRQSLILNGSQDGAQPDHSLFVRVFQKSGWQRFARDTTWVPTQGRQVPEGSAEDSGSGQVANKSPGSQ